MQWTDAADDWDEAAPDPPAVDREAVGIVWADDGFVLAPEAIEDAEEKRANALISTVVCKVGNETAERAVDPGRDASDSPED